MTTAFPAEIEDFLRGHHVMSLAVAAEGDLWAASVFYCLDRERGRLVYFSEENTIHGRLSLLSATVAATVAAQERRVDRIRGLQLRGRTALLHGPDAERGRGLFAAAFPEIPATSAPIWALTPAYLKLLDNSRGFGHKQEWRP